ncbi:hypothetical protein CMV_024352, partial [Castanea mollissima]
SPASLKPPPPPPPKPPPPPSSLFTALADAVFSLQPSPTPSSLFSRSLKLAADPRRRRLSSEARRRSTSAHAVEALNSLKLAAAGPYRLQRHRSTADSCCIVEPRCR